MPAPAMRSQDTSTVDGDVACTAGAAGGGASVAGDSDDEELPPQPARKAADAEELPMEETAEGARTAIISAGLLCVAYGADGDEDDDDDGPSDAEADERGEEGERLPSERRTLNVTVKVALSGRGLRSHAPDKREHRSAFEGGTTA